MDPLDSPEVCAVLFHPRREAPDPPPRRPSDRDFRFGSGRDRLPLARARTDEERHGAAILSWAMGRLRRTMTTRPRHTLRAG